MAAVSSAVRSSPVGGERDWLLAAGGAWALAGAAALALLFLITTLPFVRKAWGKDRAVALAAPGLLFGRAVALAVGYLRGALAGNTLPAQSPPVAAAPPDPEAR